MKFGLIVKLKVLTVEKGYLIKEINIFMWQFLFNINVKMTDLGYSNFQRTDHAGVSVESNDHKIEITH